MADDGSGEKTEEPTQKKLDDARRKGQVWKSRDFTAVAVFLTGLGALKVMEPTIRSELTKLFNFGFDHLAHPQHMPEATSSILLMGVISIVVISFPVAGVGAVMAALVDFLQVGPVFSMDTVLPQMDKLNPVNGFKNLFSKKQLVEGLKSSVKIFVTGYVVYGVIKNSLGLVVVTVQHGMEAMLAVMEELVTRVAIRVSLLFLLFALFDLWFQRRSFMKQMMMTKDEVKREYKESEGDPHHKAKRREMHHEILESAQMSAVKQSDVVVTNPDHVAVALQYDRDNDQAPRVICKGIDSRAEAIKQVAKDGDVPMMRNVPLAHALLRVEVGEEIPEELYDAVAEVLNFVYGLKDGQRQPAQA